VYVYLSIYVYVYIWATRDSPRYRTFGEFCSSVASAEPCTYILYIPKYIYTYHTYVYVYMYIYMYIYI